MNKKVLFVFVSIVVVSIGGYFIFRDRRVTNHPPKNTVTVAFGDSLVHGTGSTKGNDFVSVLSRSIGLDIENMGIPGNTTNDGLARIDSVIKKNPGVVLLLLGGNDYLQRVQKQTTFSNLNSIITKLQESGSVVVILGVRGGILSNGYADEFKKLAKEKKTLVVVDVLDGLIGDSRFMSDAVHPNDLGYAKVAKKILPILKRALP